MISDEKVIHSRPKIKKINWDLWKVIHLRQKTVRLYINNYRSHGWPSTISKSLSVKLGIKGPVIKKLETQS